MWTFYHATTFVLTFASYAFFHATRKTFSNVKSTISEEWSKTPGNASRVNVPDKIWNTHHMFEDAADAETYLGILDAVFMMSYAVGLYISGIIGDRFELRKVLSLGMCSSAVVVFLFGSVLEWTHEYNKYLYVVVWIANGLCQSLGWPTVVAIMGNWFGKSSRGFVLGLWSACASVGNIIGALMVSQVLHYGYDFAFLVTSTVLFAGGIIIFCGLINSPTEIGLQNADVSPEEPDVTINVGNQSRKDSMKNTAGYQDRDTDGDDSDTDPLLGDSEPSVPHAAVTVKSDNAISFWGALRLPGVILYALAYFCLKLINYSFFFWLPYYLNGAFGWAESTADEISIWYDIGGIIGGTIAGLLSDLLNKRTVIVVPMLVLAIPALFGYSNSPNDHFANAALMTVTGFFIGGVANLISAAISADLGKQGPVQGNKQALATVTGIVDGTGSVGAALGQILVPILSENTGWHSVFYLFMVVTFLTILCIMPLFLRELPLLVADMRRCCGRMTYSWYGGMNIPRDPAGSTSLNDDRTSDDEEA